jgi:hypothetical protein
VIFDTDVLIWALRGNRRAGKTIDEEGEPKVSIISYMELVQGARDKAELNAIRSFLRESGFTVLPLSESIGSLALDYLEDYALSGSLELADALIAATAVSGDEPLCTANTKHYRPLSDLTLKPFRPT